MAKNRNSILTDDRRLAFWAKMEGKERHFLKAFTGEGGQKLGMKTTDKQYKK